MSLSLHLIINRDKNLVSSSEWIFSRAAALKDRPEQHDESVLIDTFDNVTSGMCVSKKGVAERKIHVHTHTSVDCIMMFRAAHGHV